MKFRLVCYETDSENKYDAYHRVEFLGDRDSVFWLWFTLTRKLGEKHVEVFSLDGRKLEPEKGINGMVDYNL